MVISASARSVGTLQTTGNDYAKIYDSKTNGHNPASIMKVESVANGWVVRVNEDDTRLIVITPGTIEYIRSVLPGGITVLEAKNLVTDSNGTGYWTDAVCV